MSKKFLTLIIFVFMFSIFHTNLPAGTPLASEYNGIETKLNNRAIALATRQTRILDTKGVRSCKICVRLFSRSQWS